MAGTGRFERSREGSDGPAQRVEDEVRAARAQVYFAYLRAREQGVDLLDEPTEQPPAGSRFARPEPDGGDAAA
jgi:hypothetical protein